jgi:hypothetical protein
MAIRKKVLQDGLIAGMLGAAGVAMWFLAVDMIAGHPFYTPDFLGRALFGVLGRGIEDHGQAYFVVAYTVFHVAAFVILGIVASMLITASRKAPQFTAGMALFFVVFEMGFYFLSLMLSSSNVLGSLAWYQVGAANLVASGFMGGFLLKRHPEFAGNLTHALDGTS